MLNAKKRHGAEALIGSTVYVVRAKWENSFKTKTVQGFAKPCTGCQQHLKEFGVAQVVYTNDNSGFTCEDV